MQGKLVRIAKINELALDVPALLDAVQAVGQFATQSICCEAEMVPNSASKLL